MAKKKMVNLRLSEVDKIHYEASAAALFFKRGADMYAMILADKYFREKNCKEAME